MGLDTSIYSLVRPPPTLFNQLGEAQALRGGEQALVAGKQRIRMNEQQIQQNDQAQQQQQKAMALQQKIGQVMSQSVGPDGAPDETLLRKNFLADQDLAPHWGEVEANITKAKKGAADLQKVVLDNSSTEDERIAAMNPLLEASKYDPPTAVKLLQQLGPAVSPAKTQELLQQIQANPTPQTVQQIFTSRAAADKTQVGNKRGLADAEDLTRQAESRKADAEDKAASRALANASKMLYGAAKNDKTGAMYADAYQGLPAEVQGKFPAPARFDPETTPQDALNAAMTPDQITARTETAARNEANEAHRKALERNAELSRKATETHRRLMESRVGGAKKDADEERDFKEWQAISAHQNAELTRWSLLYKDADPDDRKANPPPEGPPNYLRWKAERDRERNPGGVWMKAPGGGPARLIPADKVGQLKKSGATIVAAP